MNTITQADANKIRIALDEGRRGAASLSQLASAHDLAERAGLQACTGELKKYLVLKVAPQQVGAGRDLLLGMTSGALTHYLLRRI